jgi:hypothetical protein
VKVQFAGDGANIASSASRSYAKPN